MLLSWQPFGGCTCMRLLGVGAVPGQSQRALTRLKLPCLSLCPQPSYTEEDAYGDQSDFEDSEAERRAAAAKAKDLIPAFMNSHEGLDDEVERILGHRCACPRSPPCNLHPWRGACDGGCAALLHAMPPGAPVRLSRISALHICPTPRRRSM